MVRSPNVDVLRAIAALAVAWFHFTNGQPVFLDDRSLLKLSGAYGYLGVPVFFVISGFVIPYSLDGMKYRFPQDVVAYAKRRFWRLYPGYIAAVVITVTLLFASQLIPATKAVPPTVDAKTIVGHLTYTAPWIGAEWYNGIYWTLAIEVQFYLAMVFFAPALLSRRKIVLFAALLAVGCMAFLSGDQNLLFWHLPSFGIGFCWFLFVTKQLSMVDAISQAAGFVIIAWITRGPAHALAGAFAFAALALPIRRPIPFLTFLGTISYSIYLLHSPIGGRVINLATRFPPALHIQIGALALALIVSIASAYLLWRFVESALSAGYTSGSPKTRPAAESVDATHRTDV